MSGAPSAPAFNPIQYVSPQPFVSAGYATGNIPAAMTGPQLANQANQTMAAGPSWPNLNNYDMTSNPSAPGGMGGPWSQPLIQQMENWYNQNVTQPAVSQAQSQMQQGGQNYGSYGPAMAGQIQAQGNQNAFQAALGANEQNYQNVLAGNQAYYSEPVALAQGQNALDINRGLNIASLNQGVNLQNQAQQNAYNLDTASMANTFNLNPEQNPNALAQQRYNDAFQTNAYNNALGLGIAAAPFGLAGGLLGSLGGGTGISSLLGGGGGGLGGLLNYGSSVGLQGGFPSSL